MELGFATAEWEEEGGTGLLFVGRLGALACAPEIGKPARLRPGFSIVLAGLLRRGGERAAMRARLVSGCEQGRCAATAAGLRRAE